MNIRINRKDDKTIILHDWQTSGVSAECVIEKTGDSDSDGHFSLKLSGGQITSPDRKDNGCEFEMYGGWERKDFVEFLKQVLTEIELIDKKND